MQCWLLAMTNILIFWLSQFELKILFSNARKMFYSKSFQTYINSGHFRWLTESEPLNEPPLLLKVHIYDRWSSVLLTICQWKNICNHLSGPLVRECLDDRCQGWHYLPACLPAKPSDFKSTIRKMSPALSHTIPFVRKNKTPIKSDFSKN